MRIGSGELLGGGDNDATHNFSRGRRVKARAIRLLARSPASSSALVTCSLICKGASLL
jgi:hypothetical protein